MAATEQPMAAAPDLSSPLDGSRHFETADTSVHFIDRGDGPPLVLIHGMGASHYTWHRIIPDLSARFRVIVPDLPGYGLTAPPPGFDYTIAEYARFLHTFLSDLSVDRTDLIAHSFGGAISEYFARRFPENVRRLVLIGSSDMEKPILEKGNEKAKHLFFHSYHDKSAIDRPGVEFGRLINKDGRVQKTTEAVCRANVHGEARTGLIEHPALILCGRHDEIVPLEKCRGLLGHFADGAFLPVDDAGHVCHEEKPAEVSRLISEFALGDGA